MEFRNRTCGFQRAGFAYIFMVGTGPDSQGMTLVFPNDRDADNAIAAGQTLVLPRTDKWRLLPGGPAGTDHLLAVVASRPIDFSKAGTSKAAIFQQSGTTTRALAGIQRALTRTLVVDAPEAPDASYGAALLKINEYD